MLYNYLALLFFMAFAVFMPVSFLLTAKLLSKREPGNPVKNAPYESGEETVGNSRDIDNEYLPYFMIFLPFEVVVAIMLLWSTAAGGISHINNLGIIILGIFATAMAFIGYRMANSD